MPATQRGIYHNLKESEYVASNSDVTFFFSSQYYLNKFLDGYAYNREKFFQRYAKIVVENYYNLATLADIQYYLSVEKRGFYVWLKGSEISCQELHMYALRKMTEKVTLEWSKTSKSKFRERISQMR